MAWTALMTFTANSVLTAAQLNTYIGSGGNLSETAPAKVTTAGDLVYGTAANTLARLAIGTAPAHMVVRSGLPAWATVGQDTVAASQTTTSTAYANLTTVGPEIALTTGTFAIIGLSVELTNSGAAATTYMGCAISGATTLAANDDRAVQHVGTPAAQMSYVSANASLTAGSNTFTAKYRVSSGTGTFITRRMWVIAF